MTTIERVGARAYRVPTPAPEADGTPAWDATTIVVVPAEAGGIHGRPGSRAARPAQPRGGSGRRWPRRPESRWAR
ncbi:MULTISPECIES: hypothetical protein [unclassified Amycolatopsis]|uniref:hypothetical protein n=1 Tax=unclassified Amycolatopsis TaxID=2618356 RepID=UPI0028764472|nr:MULTISPECIES: hypothetical protein [unclassified Amycolatopsis]MDS0138736.1 hypothetical protein [Amycolatopsis sp. 505]MDS0147230.1 hypothetical protein [Amycolatopsis sp. CM201R]